MMMWQWRNSGKTWNEIRMEYERLTDTKPGRSSLSVRLAKMQDNFIDSGGRDVSSAFPFSSSAILVNARCPPAPHF